MKTLDISEALFAGYPLAQLRNWLDKMEDEGHIKIRATAIYWEIYGGVNELTLEASRS